MGTNFSSIAHPRKPVVNLIPRVFWLFVFPYVALLTGQKKKTENFEYEFEAELQVFDSRSNNITQ